MRGWIEKWFKKSAADLTGVTTTDVKNEFVKSLGETAEKPSNTKRTVKVKVVKHTEE